jgi:hypothetical protein
MLTNIGRRHMKILVACEFSGIVRDAFIAKGHDAWSCDVVPTERKGPHIINDVRNVLDAGWDMMIAHPPCDYLARSGCKHWSKWQAEQRAAIAFVDLLWNAPIPMIAIENPRGILSFKQGNGYVWRRYDDLIQPWMFGECEQKATCLWLKGLPPLMRTLRLIGEYEKRVHSEGPGKQRKANRSRTLPGIAAAMAAQWAA